VTLRSQTFIYKYACISKIREDVKLCKTGMHSSVYSYIWRYGYMSKTVEQVRAKLEERVASSGKYHREGMENADVNPNEAALKNLDVMKARFNAAMDSGKTAAGMKEAAQEKRWEKRVGVAAARWEESSGHMTERYMEGLPQRMGAIDAAKKTVAHLPRNTLEQRAEKSKQYQIAVSKEMAKIRGIKGK